MMCAAFASPSDAGAMHPHGLAFAPCAVAPAWADGLGAVARRAPGSRIRAIRLSVALAAPSGRVALATVSV
jgi:hypothetical protein